MARLIDADALRARMYHEAFETDTEMQKWDSGCWIRYKLFENCIDAAPTLSPDDVRGVGEWIETAMPSGWYDVTCAECSVCGEDFMLGDYCMDDVRDLFHYCPSCGARMKGVSEDA